MDPVKYRDNYELTFVQTGRHRFVGAGDDVADFPGQPVGFGDTPDLGVAITGAQQLTELPGAVSTFVVHLHHQDVVESGKDVFQTGRDRVQMLDVQGGNAVPSRTGAVDRFLDRPLGRAPADQQDVAFGRAVDLWHGQFRAQLLQFLAAL